MPPLKTRSRKSARSTIGSLVRYSMIKNAVIVTAETAKHPRISPEVQPWLCPSIRA